MPDDTGRYRIDRTSEDDGHVSGDLLRCEHRGGAITEQNIWVIRHQFICEEAEMLVLVLSPTELDCNILIHDESRRLKPLTEGRNFTRIVRELVSAKNAYQGLRLLRVRDDRTRRRAAQQTDKFSSPHFPPSGRLILP